MHPAWAYAWVELAQPRTCLRRGSDYDNATHVAHTVAVISTGQLVAEMNDLRVLVPQRFLHSSSPVVYRTPPLLPVFV